MSALPTRLGPGREFDLIRRLASTGGGHPHVRVGPGDDAAVLDDGTVLTCDLSVEHVHFRDDWLEPAEVGWRAATATLSDLAAMAARPVAVLVAWALPGDAAEWVERAQRGIDAACAEAGVAVVGGDVTRSPGPRVVDVIGVGRADRPLLRSGARPGDEVWVTGTLGAAAAALRVFARGGTPLPALRHRLSRPEARTREALWLVDRAGVRAGIDLSDGLAGDAGHLASAGDVRIVLEADAIPVAEGVADALHPEAGQPDDGQVPGPALRLALHGGEDYELCLVAQAGALQPLVVPFRDRFALELTRVGRVEPGRGVHLERDGRAVPLERGGFDHFRAEEA